MSTMPWRRARRFPRFFGSLSDLIACEAEYEASTDYLDDQAYWTKNLPAESEPPYGLARPPRTAVNPTNLLHRWNWTLLLSLGSESCRRRWGCVARR